MRQATSSYRRARNIPDLRRTAPAIWRFFDARAHRTHEPVGQFRVALQADAVFRAVAALPQAHLAAISDGLEGAIGDTLHNPYSEWRMRIEARDAMASDPDLAWFLAEIEGALIAQAATWKAADVGWLDQPWERHPAALLRDLQRQQIDLSLNDEGCITVSPKTALRVGEWIGLRKHAPALAKLVAREGNCSFPIFVA